MQLSGTATREKKQEHGRTKSKLDFIKFHDDNTKDRRKSEEGRRERERVRERDRETEEFAVLLFVGSFVLDVFLGAIIRFEFQPAIMSGGRTGGGGGDRRVSVWRGANGGREEEGR